MNNSIIDKTETKLKQPFEGIGRLISTMRDFMGMTRAELADEIGCTTATVGKWESGEVLPKQGKVLELARVFDTSPENLLMGMSGIESAETETPEQAELTNQVLRDTIDKMLGKGKSEDLATLADLKNIVPESDQEIEERIGTYKGDDKPAFNLIFAGSELAHVRIANRCKSIDISPTDFPVLLIDLLSEKVRGE